MLFGYGTFVVRTNMKRSGSFGILFITHKTNERINPEDVIRHEYGHTKQLEQLGIINFALFIGLPSWREWSTDSYYDRPWEVTADIYGGVQSRTPAQDKVETGETFYQLQKESCFKKYILPRYYVFEYYKAFINKEYEQCICLTETYMKKIRKNSVNGKLQWLVAQKNLAIAYYEIGNIDKSKEIFQWFVENTPKLDAFYNTSVKYLESIESGSSIKLDSIIPDEKEMVKYESEFRSAEKKERMKKVVALIFCLFAIIMYIVSGYIRHTKEKYEAQLDAAVTEKYNNGRKLLFFNIEKDDKKVISVCLIEDDYNLILAEIVSDDNGQTLDALEITENIDFNTIYDKKTVSGYYIGFTVLSDKPSGKILDYSLEFEFIDNTYWLYIDYVEKEPRS